MVRSGTLIPDHTVSVTLVPHRSLNRSSRLRIGWKIETAAKMLGVYAALNPGRAMVVDLTARAEQNDAGG